MLQRKYTEDENLMKAVEKKQNYVFTVNGLLPRLKEVLSRLQLRSGDSRPFYNEVEFLNRMLYQLPMRRLLLFRSYERPSISQKGYVASDLRRVILPLLVELKNLNDFSWKYLSVFGQSDILVLSIAKDLKPLICDNYSSETILQSALNITVTFDIKTLSRLGAFELLLLSVLDTPVIEQLFLAINGNFKAFSMRHKPTSLSELKRHIINQILLKCPSVMTNSASRNARITNPPRKKKTLIVAYLFTQSPFWVRQLATRVVSLRASCGAFLTHNSKTNVVGRDTEVRTLIRVLTRNSKANPLLVGEPGVGKYSTLKKLLQWRNVYPVPDRLVRIRFFRVDWNKVVSQAGEWEDGYEALHGILRQLFPLLFWKDTIIVIRELSKFIQEDNSKVQNFLRDKLEKLEIQVIGFLTPAEYKKSFEKMNEWSFLVQPIFIEEPSRLENFEILRSQQRDYELYYRIRIPDSVLRATITFSKYLSILTLPQRALDILDETCSNFFLTYQYNRHEEMTLEIAYDRYIHHEILKFEKRVYFEYEKWLIRLFRDGFKRRRVFFTEKDLYRKQCFAYLERVTDVFRTKLVNSQPSGGSDMVKTLLQLFLRKITRKRSLFRTRVKKWECPHGIRERRTYQILKKYLWLCHNVSKSIHLRDCVALPFTSNDVSTYQNSVPSLLLDDGLKKDFGNYLLHNVLFFGLFGLNIERYYFGYLEIYSSLLELTGIPRTSGKVYGHWSHKSIKEKNLDDSNQKITGVPRPRTPVGTIQYSESNLELLDLIVTRKSARYRGFFKRRYFRNVPTSLPDLDRILIDLARTDDRRRVETTSYFRFVVWCISFFGNIKKEQCQPRFSEPFINLFAAHSVQISAKFLSFFKSMQELEFLNSIFFISRECFSTTLSICLCKRAKPPLLAQLDFVWADIIITSQLDFRKSNQFFKEPVIKMSSQSYITAEHVAKIVSTLCGKQLSKLSKNETNNLLNLERRLQSKIIGQLEAVEAVSKSLRRSSVGLKDPKRPIASFVFAGPSGTGKTELTKALAATYFGSEDSLIRLDMSEYMEGHSITRLIGAPPGYVGYDEGGFLTEQVRKNPFSLVLFDEIEKAHRDIFNVLLQLLDDGRLTDSHGKTVDFSNTFIILTSNVGASKILDMKSDTTTAENEQKGNLYDRMKIAVLTDLGKIFRPELINRLDDTIVFRQLTKRETCKIAEIFLVETANRLKANKNIVLIFTKRIKEYLVVKGYEPRYGARPMRRAITHYVEDPLAERLLSQAIKPDTIICVDISPASSEDQTREFLTSKLAPGG